MQKELRKPTEKKKKGLKQRLKGLWQWLRQNFLNRTMIVPTVLGELTFWSPLIVTGLLALIVSPNYWAVFGAIYTFWVWILPAIPIQLAFIALYAFIYKKLKRVKKGNTNDNN